jgi:outer membrane biosynthesis protein TonB
MTQASVAKKQTGKNEQVALVNAQGELVRVFHLVNEDGEALSSRSKVTLVYRHDRRRIEPSLSIAELRAEGAEFEVLQESTIAELRAKPYRVGVLGQITVVDIATLKLAPSYELKKEEDRRDLILAGKWIGGVQVALILISLVLGHFLVEETKKEEVITTIRPIEIEKLAKVEPPPVVQPMTRPPVEKVVPPKVNAIVKREIVKREQPRVVTKRAQIRPSMNRKATARIPKTEPKLESMGALGALGGVSKKLQSGGGLNLNGSSLARGGDRGTGGGGVGSSGTGGVAGALFGKGLIAASNGSGARAGSAGGYGTKGRGGGREGYGNRSMLGASGGYVLPLDGESFIQGGLTREQVEEVISRNMGQIRYCYEKGLQVEPSLKGRVAVSFVIGAGGQVSTARVQHSSVESRQLEGCIVGRLKDFKFPRPVAGVNVQVQYPFSFRRVSSTDVVGVN